MLVSTMNHQEITKEIQKEQEIFNYSTTILRLTLEYFDERKKKKIKKEDEYPRYYEIKTKAKNKWIILLTKERTLEKYNSPMDNDVRLFTYYYSEKGIRVFECLPEEIVVHNQHFFVRYRERMNLNILNILDVVKLYHKINSDPKYSLMAEEDGRCKFIAIVNDGFAMGEYIVEDNWYINKTFLAKSAPNSRFTSVEKLMITSLAEYLITLDKIKDKGLYDEVSKLLRSLVPGDYNDLLKEAHDKLGES